MSFGISAGAWLVGGAAVGSALIGANAAGDAADAQAGAAAASDATQRYMYDKTREDNAPFRNTGVAANNQLAVLLGLNPDSGMSRDQIRNELLSQYTTPGTQPAYSAPDYSDDAGLMMSEILQKRGNLGYGRDMVGNVFGSIIGNRVGGQSSIDEKGLNAAIDRRMAEQQRDRAARASDPQYGSLMRKFSQSDMNADPVYQNGLKFGLDQGTQGINRQAAAGGNFLSGATLKALTRFGNDYGSTKANESYNRFNADQNSQYNKLAGLSGAGQQATNQISSAGQNMANQVSQSQLSAGDARASGYMGKAQAWNNAIGTGINAWQQNRLWSQPSSGGFYPYGGSNLDVGNVS